VETAAVKDYVATPPYPRFYVWMAVVFLLVTFGGFTPSYWARLASGGFHPPPIMHIHGALLFAWSAFYLAQTAWVASGRTPMHRAWGLAGIALFTLVLCSIVILKITILRLDEARGLGEASRRFSAVAICALPMMIGMFGLAIANVKRPDIHKRLMYVLMAGMTVPAIGRVFLALLAHTGALDGGPSPSFVALPPAIVAELFIVAAVVHDWRAGRRLHPAYLYGGLTLLLVTGFSVLISYTSWWLGIAAYLEGLAG